MSLVVAGYGVPHTPAFPALVKHRTGPWEDVVACYETVAARVAADRLDTLVVFSSDHFNTFFLDNFPTFAIGVTDATSGPNDDTPELPARSIPVDRDLADAIFGAAIRSGFDLARVEELTLDHTFVVPLHFLRVDDRLPIVPIHINSFVAPQPAAARAFALGQAVRRAIESDRRERRVGVLGTGSFSLEVGGPRSAPGQPFGVPDVGWTRQVCRALDAGDLETLIAQATPEQFEAAGNASAELLDWLAMLGTTGAGTPDTLRMQASFGHAYGTWSAAGEA